MGLRLAASLILQVSCEPAALVAAAAAFVLDRALAARRAAATTG